MIKLQTHNTWRIPPTEGPAAQARSEGRVCMDARPRPVPAEDQPAGTQVPEDGHSIRISAVETTPGIDDPHLDPDARERCEQTFWRWSVSAMPSGAQLAAGSHWIAGRWLPDPSAPSVSGTSDRASLVLRGRCTVGPRGVSLMGLRYDRKDLHRRASTHGTRTVWVRLGDMSSIVVRTSRVLLSVPCVGLERGPSVETLRQRSAVAHAAEGDRP